MVKRIIFYEERCTNCSLCAMYCSLTFSEQGCYQFRPYESRIRVRGSEDGSLYVAHVCLQCDDAPCLNSCPVDAITRENSSGIIVIDEQACTGCESCIEACPFDCVFMADEKAIKCEVCDDPLCVKACAVKALALVDDHEVDRATLEKLYREVR